MDGVYGATVGAVLSVSRNRTYRETVGNVFTNDAQVLFLPKAYNRLVYFRMAWEDCQEMSMCFLRVSHRFKIFFACVISFVDASDIELHANLQWNVCLWK